MKTADIKQLLNAYYEGEISPADEQLLLDYFTGDVVAPELAQEAYIFLQMHNGDEVETPSGLESKLDSLINNLAEEEVKKPQLQLITPRKKNNVLVWFSAIAACAAILISVIFVMNKPQEVVQPQLAYQNTYTNPNEAYEEAEKALLLISKNLNKGLSRVEEANQGVEKANEVVNNSLNLIKRK